MLSSSQSWLSKIMVIVIHRFMTCMAECSTNHQKAPTIFFHFCLRVFSSPLILMMTSFSL